ncbi:MAG: DUF4397 domain-containing protein [Bacteroidetes bacterium]|nr:MAG: DUF4397 domain-containing protein [Bacteroidota bacterium]
MNGKKTSPKAMVKSLKTGAFCCVLLLFWAGCQKPNANFNTRISMLNAVPGTLPFSVEINGRVLTNNLLYGSAKFYEPTPSATTTVRWKRNSSTGFDSSFVTDLPNGTDFTLLFFDSVQRYQTVLMRDNWQQPKSGSQGYLRLLPMVVNARSLRLTNDTGRTIISGRAFADFKNSTSLQGFTATDTTTNNTYKLFNGSVLLDSIMGVNVLGGTSYSIYAIGVLNATGVNKPKLVLHQHQ